MKSGNFHLKEISIDLVLKKYFPLLFLIMMTSQAVQAQTDFRLSMEKFQQSRNDINRTAMIVLGSWAAGNILTGVYGNFKAKGEAKYFNQFNAMWNVVNLGIATFGYLSASNSDPSLMGNASIFSEYSSMQSFLLLNAGLDVAYIATGLYLKEKSKNSSSGERLRGYGNSLLLQGGFLLLFDTALYFIHQSNASVNLYPHIESLTAGGVGLIMNINF